MNKPTKIIGVLLVVLVGLILTVEFNHFYKLLTITPFSYEDDVPEKIEFYQTKLAINKIKNLFVDPQELSSIDNIYLDIKPELYEQMASDPPNSGRNSYTQPAQIRINEEDASTVKIKYRGDTDHHWRFPKKSLRIVTTNGEASLLGKDQLELISPKGYALLGEGLLAYLSEEVGVITPRHRYVNFFINGQFQGVFQASEPIDHNQFLVDHDLPLGSIFEAENISFSRQPGIGYTVYLAPFSWKNKIEHSQMEAHAQKIFDLTKAIEAESLEQFYSLVDYDYFLKIGLIQYISQTRHWSDRHNVKLYFNPEVQKFQQIPWDAAFLNEKAKHGSDYKSSSLDIISNEFYKLMHRNPVFVNDKHQYIYQQAKNGIFKSAINFIDEQAAEISDSVKQDYLWYYRGEWHNYNKWQEYLSNLKASLLMLEEKFYEDISAPDICFIQKGNQLEIKVYSIAAYQFKNRTLYPSRRANGTYAIPAATTYSYRLANSSPVTDLEFTNTITGETVTIPSDKDCNPPEDVEGFTILPTSTQLN